MASSQATTPKELALGNALKGDLVVVLVGTDQTKYSIHQLVLTHHSEYFRNALRASWKEAEHGVIQLADVDVEIFDLFAQWIYTQSMSKSGDDKGKQSTADKRVMAIPDFWLYLKAMVLGDRFLAKGFQDAAYVKIRTLLNLSGIWNDDIVSVICHAYDNIPSRHPILQLLADAYRFDMLLCEHNRRKEGTIGVPDSYRRFKASSQQNLPTDFVVRVIRGNQQYNMNPGNPVVRLAVWMKKHCYLDHSTDEDTEKCEKLHVGYDEDMGYGFYEQEDGFDE